MNFADLEAFVAVAETGSVNRAGIRLHLTQPAITRRVQNFEAAMGGAALLDRSSKPPSLTAVGRQALEYCRRVLAAVQDLRRSGSETSEPAGELRIGTAHGLAEIVIAAPLDDLRRRFPQLRMRISGQWTSWLIEEVRNGGLDCAVALLTQHQPLPAGIIETTVGSERVVIVAAKDQDIARKGKLLRLRDLAECGWILNTAGCGYREALRGSFDRIGIETRISAEILGYDLQLSMIARGAGLGLVPWRRFNGSPHRPHLRVLRIKDFTLEARVAMLRNPALGNMKLAIDWLQATIAAALRDHKE